MVNYHFQLVSTRYSFSPTITYTSALVSSLLMFCFFLLIYQLQTFPGHFHFIFLNIAIFKEAMKYECNLNI